MDETRKQALHVEDGENFRRVIGKELSQRLGFNLAQYGAVPIALAYIAGLSPVELTNLALVVVDGKIPDETGEHFGQEVLNALVAVSWGGLAVEVSDNRVTDAQHYFPKSGSDGTGFDNLEFRGAIQKLMGSS